MASPRVGGELGVGVGVRFDSFSRTTGGLTASCWPPSCKTLRSNTRWSGKAAAEWVAGVGGHTGIWREMTFFTNRGVMDAACPFLEPSSLTQGKVFVPSRHTKDTRGHKLPS